MTLARATDEEIDSTGTPIGEYPFLSLLERAQKEDGGWGFHVNSESRVEPACWALLALLQIGAHKDLSERLSRGLQFLKSAQLPNGSWPAVPGQQDGCWVTSLACWVLLCAKHFEDPYPSVAPAFRWLGDDWPKDTSAWRRILERFSRKDVVSHNPSYRGWGWTPRTASWVEPTSFALIAMSQAAQELLPPAAKRRQRLAQLLLCDRMCPGGGWNCGNPRTYGVAGEPLVSPTVWALIALRNEHDRPEVQESLAWLEKNVAQFRSSVSLALARICLETYGRQVTITDQDLRRAFGKNEFPENTSAISWASLACRARPNWLVNRPENG